ncbi:MAG: hypothetical protein OEY66_10640 [Gammaproteobacteria bacterium]|nr:hypothetical protein [Gammaproteobacteria bacterium]
MTPTIYSAMGRRFSRNKKNLWLIVVLALLVIAITAFAYSKLNIVVPYQIPFGISAIFLLSAWGILISVYWFSPDGKMSPEKIEEYTGIKRAFNQFISWNGAILLSIWFASIISVLPWFLWKQVTNG